MLGKNQGADLASHAGRESTSIRRGWQRACGDRSSVLLLTVSTTTTTTTTTTTNPASAPNSSRLTPLTMAINCEGLDESAAGGGGGGGGVGGSAGGGVPVARDGEEEDGGTVSTGSLSPSVDARALSACMRCHTRTLVLAEHPQANPWLFLLLGQTGSGGRIADMRGMLLTITPRGAVSGKR